MIALLVVLAIILYAAEQHSLLHVFDKVSMKTDTDRVLVEPDETFIWTMMIENKKRLMVPYLKIKEAVPEGILFSETKEPVEPREQAGLISTLYLAGKQQVRMEREVILPKRGRYFFRGATAEAGDFLGFRSVSETRSELVEVVVKPRPAESVILTNLLGGYLGEHAVRRGLMEDPINTIGFREYTGREPFRSISWTQSAKNNRLLVKQYENTVDFSCTVILVLGDASPTERMEHCFSMVRSICEELEKKQITYDFHTNASIAGAMGNWQKIGEGLGSGHLEAVLEALGRMTGSCREQREVFLQKEIRLVPHGRSFILAAPERTEELESAAKRLEELSGRQTLFLCTEEIFEQ